MRIGQDLIRVGEEALDRDRGEKESICFISGGSRYTNFDRYAGTTLFLFQAGNFRNLGRKADDRQTDKKESGFTSPAELA